MFTTAKRYDLRYSTKTEGEFSAWVQVTHLNSPKAAGQKERIYLRYPTVKGRNIPIGNLLKIVIQRQQSPIQTNYLHNKFKSYNCCIVTYIWCTSKTSSVTSDYHYQVLVHKIPSEMVRQK